MIFDFPLLPSPSDRVQLGRIASNSSANPHLSTNDEHVEMFG